MATYTDLRQVFGDGYLLNKVDVAVAVKAQTIIDSGTATAEQLAWASQTLTSPRPQSEKFLKYILAVNKALEIGDPETGGTILGASDVAIQTNVNSAVDVFYPPAA